MLGQVWSIPAPAKGIVHFVAYPQKWVNKSLSQPMGLKCSEAPW